MGKGLVSCVKGGGFYRKGSEGICRVLRREVDLVYFFKKILFRLVY